MYKSRLKVAVFAVAALAMAASAWALSVALHSPEIRFPNEFDKKTAAAIEAVLNDKRFKYVDGLYSHWPPKWSTTLVYDGDAKALKGMIDALAAVKDMHVKVTFSKDLSKESGTGHSAGSWWVEYSHETPDVLELRVNLARVDVSELALTAAEQK